MESLYKILSTLDIYPTADWAAEKKVGSSVNVTSVLWRMSFSGVLDVVHPGDAPSFHRKLLCTLWCLLVSQTSLCSCLLCRLSSLSVWLLIIQRQTDLRSSAAAAKEKQERWRSSIRPTGHHTHEIRGQLFGRSLGGGEDLYLWVFLLYFQFRPRFLSLGFHGSTRTSFMVEHGL